MDKFNLNYFRLKGKIALVTGGNGNLGPYWVMALLEAGAKVVILDLPGKKKPEILEKLRQEFKERIFYYEVDITEIDFLEKVHKKINENIGLIQIIVNNAGIDAPPIKNAGNFNNLKEQNDEFTKMWKVNVQGMVNCIEEFYPDMKKSGGSIINIGSLYMERAPYKGLYSHIAYDKPWIYGATKAAVGQVTRHYATRLAELGIRVNTLSPGGVYANQDKEFVRKYSSRVPMGRMAEKESDLGGSLVFLASQASKYITGINLPVNGGYTAW